MQQLVISMVSNKGGVAKTTSAVHLARYLVTHQGEAALIDGDHNASALLWAAQGEGFGFPVFSLRNADQAKARYLVVDSPARPSPEELAYIVEHSAIVIVPTMVDVVSLGATIKMLASKPFKNYAVLLTAVEPTGKNKHDAAREALEAAGHPVLQTVIRRYTSYKNAQDQGVTVDMLVDRSSRQAWGDYVSLGEELMA